MPWRKSQSPLVYPENGVQIVYLQTILNRATGLKAAALTVKERPPLAYQSNRLYDVWAGDQHLIAKEYLRPDELPPTLCFCRSDARFANVIQRPDGRLGLVDWEDSGLRDPACEVADLLTHANQEDMLDEQGWRPFLDHYLPVHQTADAAFAERLRNYLAIFPIFWLALLLNAGVQRAQAGALSGWQINEMPANERLRRYLARALAWPDAAFDSQLASLPASRFFP